MTVLVGELGRGWDASEDSQAFVAGLFQACMSINDLSPTAAGVRSSPGHDGRSST
ncbi:hypothetical protein [Frankia tisae]|uniref:hypothetical protein n=1 Tax=Frankia tisae TaxID=2950104 RepID=UPI0021C11579|nr:hypothetical protein [Frankia tisae]